PEELDRLCRVRFSAKQDRLLLHRLSKPARAFQISQRLFDAFITPLELQPPLLELALHQESPRQVVVAGSIIRLNVQRRKKAVNSGSRLAQFDQRHTEVVMHASRSTP